MGGASRRGISVGAASRRDIRHGHVTGYALSVCYTASSRDALLTHGSLRSALLRSKRHPGRRPHNDGRGAESVGSFFLQVKRSAASHCGKNDARLCGRVMYRGGTPLPQKHRGGTPLPQDTTDTSYGVSASFPCVLARASNSVCQSERCVAGATCTAVTLYSGQLVAQSLCSVVTTLAPVSGLWNVV